jgi:hypothetical protein
VARNQFSGICYRCGKVVEAGTGHFEKIRGAKGFRVQHGLFPGHGRVTCDEAPETNPIVLARRNHA